MHITLSIEGVNKEIAAGKAPTADGMGNAPDTQSIPHRRTAQPNRDSSPKIGKLKIIRTEEVFLLFFGGGHEIKKETHLQNAPLTVE